MDWGTVNPLVRDSQFFHNETALYSDRTATYRNLLVYDSVRSFACFGSGTKAEHLTVNGAVRMFEGSLFTVTNSVLVAATQFASTYYPLYPGTMSLVNCVTNASAAGFFQTVGAGTHYLATNSPYRDAGTASIDPALLANLQQKTTYPPPESYADTNTLDLGFHYPQTTDWDFDGMEDGWEAHYFGNLAQTAGGDYDGDGLSNLQELQNGFNPANPDENQNGVLDGNDDWDADLLSNKAEIQKYATSPFNANSMSASYSDAKYKLSAPSITSGVSPTEPTLFWSFNPSTFIITLTYSPTIAGKYYELLGCPSLTAPNTPPLPLQWSVDRRTLALGTSVVWTYSVFEPMRFFVAGSGDDSDSDGLSDVYETWVTSTMPDVADSSVPPDGISDGAEDPDADTRSNAQEYQAGTDPNRADVDGDGLPDWWEIAHFGNLNQTAEGDYDGDGTSNAAEEAAGTNPNTIRFQASLDKTHTNIRNITGALIANGHPASMVIIYDNEAPTTASWSPYPQDGCFSAMLPAVEGNRRIHVGLKGLNQDAEAVWRSVYVIYDATPPALTVDVPEAADDGTVAKASILVTGTSPEGLKQVTFEVGTEGSLSGDVVSMEYDTTRQDYGATKFRCRDVSLQPGENIITVRALDFTGNQSVVSKVVNYDPPNPLPPTPTAVHVSFPPDNAKISGGSFVIAGLCEGSAVSVTVTADGSAPIEVGVEPKTGCFVANDISVPTEPTTYTVTAVGKSGETASTTVYVQPRQINWSVAQTVSPELVAPPTFDFTALAGEPLSSVSINGQPAAWDSDLEMWFIDSLQPNLECGPLFTRIVTLPDGTLVYELDNTPLDARFSTRSASHAWENARWDDGEFYAGGSISIDWDAVSGGTKAVEGNYTGTDGIYLSGERYYQGVYNVVYTFNKRMERTSTEASGNPPLLPSELDMLGQRPAYLDGMYPFYSPEWGFYSANVDPPPYDRDWYGTAIHYEGSFHGGSAGQFFAGGHRGDSGEELYWFRMTAEKWGYDGNEEFAPSEPIPAENFWIFGQKMHVLPDDPNTGHLIKSFPRFDVVDGTPTVDGQTWYSASPTATKINAGIYTDLNRDGQITLSEADRPTSSNPFRFWVNDDDDDGDVGGDDITKPASADAADLGFNSGSVDGNRDLIDFFPVFLDIKSILEVLPPSETVKYKLKHESGAVNFAYTWLSQSSAFLYEETLLFTGFGDNFNQRQGIATTHRATANGVELSETFLNAIQNNERGIILVEGRLPTSAPLVLAVEIDDKSVLELKLYLRFSRVEEMFRQVDVTTVAKEYGGQAITPPETAPSTRTGDPGDPWPDFLTNGKYFVFFHGFNVDAMRARGWQSEIFKRLHVRGSRARFVGVTWNGATGYQSLLTGSYTDYHKAVFNAFQTGDALGNALAFTSGADVTLAAHSLGNIVASQAIQSGSFVPARYFMINAASPIEAYAPGDVTPTQQADMVEYGWDNPLQHYEPRLYAANWHSLFSQTPSDHRNELTWRDRFIRSRTVMETHNFYSPGDDVVANRPDIRTASIMPSWLGGNGFYLSYGAWKAQELVKGTTYAASLFQSRGQAGWGFNSAYDTVLGTDEYGREIRSRMSASGASGIASAELMTEPFHGRFLESDLMSADAQVASHKAEEKIVQYDVLARAIPALSYAVAPNQVPALNLPGEVRNYNMEALGHSNNPWPTDGHSESQEVGRWLHSDFRQVSLLYVYPMFDEMIQRGGLK